MIKVQAELISILAYTDKKSNTPKTRIGYRLLDNKYRQDTAKLKGFSELSVYIDGHDAFNKIKADWCGCQVELELEERPSTTNPLRNVQVIKCIKAGDNVISLL